VHSAGSVDPTLSLGGAILTHWRDAAMQCGISRADIELTATAFSAHQQFGMQ